MLTHPSPQSSPPSIQAVIDLVLDKSPMMVTADIGTVYMWLNEGCDLELDIIPTMKEIFKKMHGRKKITTFSYFNNPVREARDKRLNAPKIAKPEPLTDAQRARNIVWKRERINGYMIPSQDEEWLRKYELINGSVTL